MLAHDGMTHILSFVLNPGHRVTAVCNAARLISLQLTFLMTNRVYSSVPDLLLRLLSFIQVMFSSKNHPQGYFIMPVTQVMT